jgi:hypothetical protein
VTFGVWEVSLLAEGDSQGVMPHSAPHRDRREPPGAAGPD